MIDPYEKLANGIILQAVNDYRQAMKNGEHGLQARIEHFFHSAWFGRLSTLDPDVLIQRLQEEAAA